MVWLPVFGIFNVHTDVDVCDCTRALYGHRKSLRWKLTLGKNLLLHQELKPPSVLHLAFQSDAQFWKFTLGEKSLAAPGI